MEISYDALGRVSTIRDGENRSMSYLPAGLGYGGHENPRSGLVQVRYDADDRPVAQTDERGWTTRTTYDGRGRVRERTYPEGNRVAFGYDAKNNTTSIRKYAKPGSAEDGQSLLITATYDPLWNKPSSITDARNGVTSFTYVSPGSGGGGNLATQTMPSVGGISPSYNFTYNSFGQLLTSSDPTNMVVSSTYLLSAGRYLSTITLDPGGVGTSLSFTTNPAGDVTQIDGARTDVVDVSTATYDAARRKRLEIAPQVGDQRTATNTIYGPRGLVEKIERGYVSNAAFTALETDTFVYDNANNRIRTITAAGITQTDYDELNRVTCTAIRMNPDTYGSLPSSACSVTAAGVFGPDQISRRKYDPAGQLESIELGLGFAEAAVYASYTYTANGKQSAILDGKRNKTGLVYDGFDRLKQIRFPHKDIADTLSSDDFEEYGYDNSDNRTSWRRRDNQVIGYQYDALNRVTLKDLPGGSGQDVYYAYDTASRMTEARLGSLSGQGVVIAYDTAGRKATETTFGRQVASLYDTAGNRIRVTWPDNIYATYAYDAANRLSSIKESGTISLVSLNYGPLDRRLQLSRPNGTQTTYGYDVAGRLNSLSNVVGSGGQNSHQTLTYAPSSQVSTLTQTSNSYVWTGQPAAEQPYTHDGLNRVSTIAALSGGYDLRGNLTYDGQRTFVYNVENRLTSATSNAGGASIGLTYDPTGRLYETSTSGGAVTRFLYDGDKLVGEYDGVSGGLLRRYVHGVGIDEPLVWYEGPGTSNRRFLHADRQGSVIAWTNSSGTPTIYTYGPYGEPQDWQGSRFRYTGQIVLPEAQLYHYKARVYDPMFGRFLQTDPIGQQDDPNVYMYVRGDPANRTDPTGLETYDCTKNSAACPKEMKISELQKGDIIKTDGARVRVGSKGSMSVTLNPGYENGRAAAKSGPNIVPVGPSGASVRNNIVEARGKSAFWFRDQVKNRGPWDYKQNKSGNYEAYGNFNYGATGRAVGFAPFILLQEAGRAQEAAGTSKEEWGDPGIRLVPGTGTGSNGDDPIDQYWIQQGMRHHDR